MVDARLHHPIIISEIFAMTCADCPSQCRAYDTDGVFVLWPRCLLWPLILDPVLSSHIIATLKLGNANVLENQGLIDDLLRYIKVIIYSLVVSMLLPRG